MLVANIAELALAQPPHAAAGVELVPVVDQAGVEAMVRVHDEVFGGDHTRIGRAVPAGLTAQPRPLVGAVLAVAAGTAVEPGRVQFCEGTEFAGLCGGGTLPAWRRRGVFRSLVAYRAGLARPHGFRYLQVDASAQSLPILQRFGFVELATTTPYMHPPGTR